MPRSLAAGSFIFKVNAKKAADPAITDIMGKTYEVLMSGSARVRANLAFAVSEIYTTFELEARVQD